LKSRQVANSWPAVAVAAQLALIVYLVVANHVDLYP
jgi:hypothetical protein